MDTITYLLVRLALAISLFGHGLVRLPKLTIFSNWMIKSFESSMLPKLLVIPFSYTLPIADFIIGTLLILGLFTKTALVMGGIVMLMLVLGTCLIENWEALQSQMIHVAFIAILLQFVKDCNEFSLDSIIFKP